MDVGLPLVWFSWASLKSTTPEVSLRKGARGPEPATDRKNRPPSPPHGTEGDLADDGKRSVVYGTEMDVVLRL